MQSFFRSPGNPPRGDDELRRLTYVVFDMPTIYTGS
jgi:hypothetical protein